MSSVKLIQMKTINQRGMVQLGVEAESFESQNDNVSMLATVLIDFLSPT